ncbi:unnamed protein product [Acanthoscelides obtectus]|uniref:Transposase Tc1-like domain-containing protein n=1 Tax=Acanthoscelides obtectus TaxID=200917 RepID=A0A9P0K671_ACAOB|nr:unnamed protein product [Acanthoscelides obtectus]CAK1633158.1 hypothetical protein AOBTE_LOCUS7972 [Acanthoscelides obtectus]
MVKTGNVSLEKRDAVCTLRDEGLPIRAIAETLHIGRNTVSQILKKKRETASVVDCPRNRRRRVTTVPEDRLIVITSKRNRHLTSPELTHSLNRTRENPVSVSTLKRRLQRANLRGCVATRKPLLRPIHKRNRLAWAQKHKDCNIDDWNRVL